MIDTLLGSVGTWFVGMVMVLIGGAATYFKIRDGGKKAAKREAKERDHDRANEIRRRVDAAKKRADADDRPVNERLRELGGLRDGD
ncbi:hypothetical protein [Herbaspirillum sp.]|uniref:hypothetical protein n=1 Tax=Herbaspirillum sp. TaxID=1890675 RepID=UPI00258CFF4C|nr:hypothetical protein [Herbaspirillum sp.]MCP3947349.1 hypothetical protein [Herbaspirillum sp.]